MPKRSSSSSPFRLRCGDQSYIRTDPKLESVCKVGKVEISQNEFNEAVRGQIDQMKRQFGGRVDTNLLDTPEMRKSILDSAGGPEALRASGVDLPGATVSDAALRDKIAGERHSSATDNSRQEQYQSFLKSQGMSSGHSRHW